MTRHTTLAVAACAMLCAAGIPKAKAAETYTIFLNKYCNIYEVTVSGKIAVGQQIGCGASGENVIGSFGLLRRVTTPGTVVLALADVSGGTSAELYFGFSTNTITGYLTADGVNLVQAPLSAVTIYRGVPASAAIAAQAHLPNYMTATQ